MLLLDFGFTVLPLQRRRCKGREIYAQTWIAVWNQVQKLPSNFSSFKYGTWPTVFRSRQSAFSGNYLLFRLTQTFKQAWKGSCNSLPLITMFGKSNRWTCNTTSWLLAWIKSLNNKWWYTCCFLFLLSAFLKIRGSRFLSMWSPIKLKRNPDLEHIFSMTITNQFGKTEKQNLYGS